MKKSSIKKISRGSQIRWFIGIYLISVLGLGLFYLFSHWLINILKS